VDTRTIWTGNAARQPMLRGAEFRLPEGGVPNCDAVMERGVLLPLSHALDDDDVDYVTGLVEEFLTGRAGG
jgi:CDP-6-deoxy-D-xylo-4-hexulose-3-dehydrase